MVTRVDSARRTTRPRVNSTSGGPLVLVARRTFDPQRVTRVRARAAGEGRCAKQRAESNACGRSVLNQTPSSAARFQLLVVDVCFQNGSCRDSRGRRRRDGARRKSYRDSRLRDHKVSLGRRPVRRRSAEATLAHPGRAAGTVSRRSVRTRCLPQAERQRTNFSCSRGGESARTRRATISARFDVGLPSLKGQGGGAYT